MVIYDLCCEAGHRFEGWFDNAAAFESQQAESGLSCPVCGATQVRRLPSASHINRGRARNLEQAQQALDGAGEQARAALTRLHDYVDRHFDDVGSDFAEEARRIHYGECPERHIRGQATHEEVRALGTEGVETFALPPRPVDKTKLN